MDYCSVIATLSIGSERLVKTCKTCKTKGHGKPVGITSNDTSCGLLWMDERLSTGMNICPSWADISLLAQVLEELMT